MEESDVLPDKIIELPGSDGRRSHLEERNPRTRRADTSSRVL